MQKRPGGIIIGQKGQKYGLIQRTGDKQQQQKKPGGGGGAPAKLAAFGGDSDSEEDIGMQVARQAARKVADSKVRV
jgi:hypothetical protein